MREAVQARVRADEAALAGPLQEMGRVRARLEPTALAVFQHVVLRHESEVAWCRRGRVDNGSWDAVGDAHMSLVCATAYRLGITPWERAGQASAEHFAALLDREERERPRPLGRALDLGCGNGTHSIEMASRGWQVTGVDAVARAVRTAQERARQAGATVRFVEADVTDLQSAGLGSGFAFVLDVGCFHGLDDRQRAATGRAATMVTTADATLLMLAFRPGHRGPLPRGASAEQIEVAFPLGRITDEQLADTTGMPGPLKKAAPHWYRLRRSGG